ncbi:BRD4-interacting chromatin-remodeling complex-associated protein-like isoform X1 [Clarias gariepinus]|uniref:BRD4-interacting chromatin-remodeling complex-associated protein-like isoform X1 n=1 Tax=Clarias gariepinus TaxID=13013 RepID=UPI00234CC4E1|nr:BRD4-interacting chromatin-remodeling complex-associated protein-like isoform X1 [Clarias gariepinus]XP_053367053.1 BRD4-interacting chromatin-remodeling complex-associated protein-like isoform X1 [Clarias gariepinus]XP_053367054.1 BRD4-interacting chromatin-remodeling complex-associated protein-like isoform X1 [Clarias gariepinus]XP_053367055.1 BRD4-interacting chromatin-remodeling complex-associated protein-like isoform X1 [Clarias gariepinus]XP_053367056.1 BRD4-interacting chromatin-remod
MDDEDDRRLLDFIGDVQALNDYLHGSNTKSIEEDDLTNAAYESATSFFTNETSGSNEGLKDGHNHLEEFGEAGDSGLSSSLQFIEDELEGSVSPSGGVDLGSEDQPFDILQKSLLEADITEQTLAEEALLESQPALCPATATFHQQLVSGGVSGAGLVAPMPVAGAQPQTFIQQVPQLPLPNGPTGHIQLSLSSLNGSTPSMMTIKSLERPQILLRPGGNTVMGSAGQGTSFVPSTPGQISVPFNKGPIQLQNIIIQRGPVPQSLVRPIQPKVLQTGGQTMYNISNLGIQSHSTTVANPVNTVAYTANGTPQTTQQVKVVSQPTSIVVHSPFGQQGQPQVQANLPQGQYLLPTGSTVHGLQAVNGQVLQTNTHMGDPSLTSTTTYSILTNQNTAVQIIAGQNFAAGGQMMLNQGMINAGQMGQASPTGVMQVAQRPGVTAKVWAANPSPTPTAVQSLQAQNRLTMVNSTGQPLQTHLQISVSPGQRLLVPVAQNNTNSSHSAGQDLQFEKEQAPFNLDSALSKQKAQTQLANLLDIKGLKTANQESHLLTTLKRPANQQLSRGEMVLEQLKMDHIGVVSPDRTPFASLNDVLNRLLPYHVFHEEPPCEDDFAKVDEEFEAVSTQVVVRTQSMINKYRRLLMVEAEMCIFSQRSSPSSEIVMIDRTFNQEERNNLTQDKRTVLVDPDGFLEEFCCGPKKLASNLEAMDSPCNEEIPVLMETSPLPDTPHMQGYKERTECHIKPAYRTDAYSAFEDPGGGGGHEETFSKSSLDMKKKQSNIISSSSSQHHHFHSAHYSTSPSHSQHSSGHFYPSEQLQTFEHGHVQLSDTDSVLEAAVNSILDC